MPDLSITVTADQATRIRTALGHWKTPEPTDEVPNPEPEWVVATAGEVTNRIKALLRRDVYVFEKRQAEAAATTAVNDALATEGWDG